jgi:hypothetical protein
MSITNIPYLEVKGIFELRRIVGVAIRGYLILNTHALCQGLLRCRIALLSAESWTSVIAQLFKVSRT